MILRQMIKKTKFITHVKVSASICFPEGSLSRSVESALILESIGRYGTLICKFNVH